MKTMKKSFLLLFGALLVITSVHAAPPPNPQTQYYLNLLNSPSVIDRTRAAKEIYGTERVGPLVFERVEQLLLAGFMENMYNSDHVEEMSWMCKALASSGIATYEKTLQIVVDRTPSSKIRRHALNSIQQLAYYRERREISAREPAPRASMSPENMKLLGMLEATNLKLQKDAAKILTRRESPTIAPELYDIVEQKLLSGYLVGLNDKEHLDTMAWFCKALGASGRPKYRATLQKIISTTSNRKLIKYAKASLDQL